VRDRSADLFKGSVVVFDKSCDVKRSRNIAVHCRLINAEQDWTVLVTMLGQPDKVNIDIRSSRRDSRGRTRFYNEQQQFSLILEGARQLFQGKDSEWIRKRIYGGFEKDLDHRYLVS